MPSEAERHWSSVCLGIVTVATAAIGIALFGADIVGVNIPADARLMPLLVIKLGCALGALSAYIVLLVKARSVVIFTMPRQGIARFDRRRQANLIYILFIAELALLVGLLIAGLSLDFLAEPPDSVVPE